MLYKLFYKAAEKAALSLGGYPFFRQAFGLYYKLAVSATVKRAAAIPGVKQVFLHRGMARGDWDPGVSDIDFAVVLADGAPETSEKAARTWESAYASLKKPFPMLGEYLIASESETAFYMKSGDLRAAEFACGNLPLLPGQISSYPPFSPSALKLKIDCWNECYHAYARLCAIYFGLGSGQPRREIKGIRKSLLDIARYSRAGETAPGKDANISSPVIQSRKEVIPDDTVRGILLALDSADEYTASKLARSAMRWSMNRLETLAAEICPAPAETQPHDNDTPAFPAERPEQEAAFYLSKKLAEELGADFGWAVMDNIFESFIFFRAFKDDNSADAALQGLKRLSSLHPAMKGSIIPLCSKSGSVLASGLKIEDPLHCAKYNPGPLSQSGGAEFRAHRRAFLGGGSNISLPANFAPAKEMEQEAFARFLRSWRLFSFPTRLWPPEYRKIFVFSRALHYHEYFVHDRYMPLFPLQPLFAQAKNDLPSYSQFLDSAAANIDNEFSLEESLFITNLNASTFAALPRQ